MEKYSELLRTLLEKRGIINEIQADIFLNPDYERDLHDPFLMKDMERACVRLYEAIDAGEKIVVYADYDCDGIPGAVILNDLFKKINYKNYEIYIPQRNSEGYGLNLEAIKQFSNSGVKLLITVDLGITAVAEVAQAEVDGIDVIITDHHLPIQNPKALSQENFLGSSVSRVPPPARPLENSLTTEAFILPRAYAILNPKTDSYPEKMLSGAGVVFKFVQAFVQKYGEYFKIKNGWEKWLLDMAGLATLSDMVPLLGENRALAYWGMKVLRKSPRPGLQKLLAKMNIDQRYLSEDDIGFMVTPRLNAASRMDDPLRAYELLSTDDAAQAGVLADHLSEINDERKKIVAGIMREVNKKFENREHKEVIVIGNPEWRVGVLGLVAGKISDEHKKPVFVWGKDENDCIKGSCRSDGSVSVVELMTETRDSFLDFGGHELAGGFTVHNDKIHFLEEDLSMAYTKIITLFPPLLVEEGAGGGDLKLLLTDVKMQNWREIEKLAPFGLGNPKPVFFFESVKIENIKKFGKNGSGEHLEITFSDTSLYPYLALGSHPKRAPYSRGRSKEGVKAISFFSNHDSFDKTLSEGLNVNLLATFDLSRFRGREELRLRVENII